MARRRQARPRRVVLGFKGEKQGLGQIALGFRRDLGLKGILLGFRKNQVRLEKVRQGLVEKSKPRKEQRQGLEELGLEEEGVQGKNEIGYEEKKRDKLKTNLQANVEERSHLEGGQESKLVDAQTKLQPKSKPNKLQCNLQTLLLSCQNANQKKSRERDKEDEKK